MAEQNKLNFSHELRDGNPIDSRLEQVGHPLLKQIITQVLAEDSDVSSLGSAFGEGQVAG